MKALIAVALLLSAAALVALWCIGKLLVEFSSKWGVPIEVCLGAGMLWLALAAVLVLLAERNTK